MSTCLSEVKFIEKIGGPNLGETGKNWVRNEFFSPFSHVYVISFSFSFLV